MKYIRILFFSLFLMPFAGMAAQSEFMVAAQLLSAAKNADIQQVQMLVNNGANVNFVDATGLSLVCTALMNNDVRAAQILQMYGADASQCDRQIKKYNKRTVPERSGGLFSGLSSAQSMTLTAAGAAVVVGGLLLLTDVFNPGNENESAVSPGDRPGTGGNNNSGGNGNATAELSLPYGPSCSTDGTCPTDLTEWGPESSIASRVRDFNYMKSFNYLMMTYAYNPFLRGYFGQEIIRLSDTNTPFDLKSLPFAGSVPSGGKPINVATITANGANASGSLGDGYMTFVDGSKILNAQSICTQNGKDSAKCQEALANLTYVARKFYNRTNETNLDDVTERDGFDFSGHGTVFGAASVAENLNLKVIAGWEAGGRETGDAYGFIPNGQLTVYRTGNGWGVDENVGTVSNADDATEWATGDTFVVDGTTYTVTIGDNNTFTATDGGVDTISGTVNGTTLNFAIESGDTTTNYEAIFATGVNSLKQIDVMNFDAMLAAAQVSQSGTPWVNVIANIAQNPSAGSVDYMTAQGMHGLANAQQTDAAKKTAYLATINKYYNLDTTNDDKDNTPGAVANTLYSVIGNQQKQIIVNAAGSYTHGVGDGMSNQVLGATFENYAPALYPDLEHLFMTVVAVTNSEGTSDVTDIADYASNGGKIQLLKNANGYASRKCGMNINGGLDPWCFAAPGLSAEMAVASMSGAIGVVQGAFNGIKNMDNKKLFKLLALTADGPYLGTNPGTDKAWASTADLIAYLQSKYELPSEFSGIRDDQYLDAFKDVFGYGLINLERATRPGTKIYYYNGTNIVAADGVSANAYWRAATNTAFRSSGALNLSGERIATSAYDILESVDGSMRLPRVWETEFALGNTSKRGLYMGDVLGAMRVRDVTAPRVQYGKLGFTMNMSERAYVDNMNGLDNLMLDYAGDNWNLNASYQRYFTDGESRFNGMANPILNLASNVVTSGAEYKSGNWSFGGRGYSGQITDEGLLENDPAVSAQYMPGRLGLMHGVDSHVAFANDTFGFTASVGAARESDTLLGAMTDGLLALGAGDTTYVDVLAEYKMFDEVRLTGRATFARTSSDNTGGMIMGLTDIKSNSFALGLDFGGFEFTVAQPLAIIDGALQYAHAEYDVVDSMDGNYDLVVRDAHVADLSLIPDSREVRFSGTYRHSFGEYTDGAFGFIYRVNPNHTREFGNESIFMMKLSHRLGI